MVIGDVKCIHLPVDYYDVVCAREFIQCAPDKPEYCAQFLVSTCDVYIMYVLCICYERCVQCCKVQSARCRFC